MREKKDQNRRAKRQSEGGGHLRALWLWHGLTMVTDEEVFGALDSAERRRLHRCRHNVDTERKERNVETQKKEKAREKESSLVATEDANCK